MSKYRLGSEKISIVALGVAAGLIISGMGGMALGQFALEGIDPQLADTYRQHQAAQVAIEDHDLMGRITPVSTYTPGGMIGDEARPQTIAFQQDDALR